MKVATPVKIERSVQPGRDRAGTLLSCNFLNRKRNPKMVAPAEHNKDVNAGSFGRPIRRSSGSTWTEDEYRGLKKMAGFGSIAAAIRRLIGKDKLEQLAKDGQTIIRPENN
jgi:hypothetical protein